jgi:hypothetical protein
MKKTILLAAASTLGFLQLKAQWIGPTSDLLQTSNYVKIAKAPVFGTVGTTIPPLFLVQSLDATTVDVFKVDHNSIHFGKQALFNNSGIVCRRSNNQFAFQVTPTGNLTLTTDGLNGTGRGLFIKTPTSDILSVTNTAMTYYSGNLILKGGDLIMMDANNEIQYRVYNDGLVRAREVKVNLNVIPPDYVFEPNYNLMPFKDLETYITTNKHLPNIPSAAEMISSDGVELSTMQFKLLEKVEELTLYMIQLKKENEILKQRICALEEQ